MDHYILNQPKTRQKLYPQPRWNPTWSLIFLKPFACWDISLALGLSTRNWSRSSPGPWGPVQINQHNQDHRVSSRSLVFVKWHKTLAVCNTVTSCNNRHHNTQTGSNKHCGFSSSQLWVEENHQLRRSGPAQTSKLCRTNTLLLSSGCRPVNHSQQRNWSFPWHPCF